MTNKTNGAAPGRALKPIDEVRNALSSPAMMAQLRMALPSHIPAEKFLRVAITAIASTAGTNNDLLSADRHSLYAACMKCAQDGLLPDGREAALVVYNTKVRRRDGSEVWEKRVQYMPMIAGILKKARNSGEVANVSAHVVYANDKFVYRLGDDEQLIHEPPPLGQPRGEPIGAYAVFTLANGEKVREVMSRQEIEAVRAVSKSKDSGPWAGAFATEMWRKTVLRRCAKRVPMSTDKGEELRRVIERDDDLYDFDGKGDTTPEMQPEAQAEKPQSEPRKRRPRGLRAVAEAPPPPPPPPPQPPQQQPETPPDDANMGELLEDVAYEEQPAATDDLI